MRSKQKTWADLSLLTGAVFWGVIWYPLRVLEQNGVSGELATFIAYSCSLLLGLAIFWKSLRQMPGHRWLLFGIALGAGWTNLGYALAVIHGEVVRVVLLFYLAPLWTVVLARMLLAEQLNVQGYLVMVWALGGAIVMLWTPEAGLPLPRNWAEWLALSGGFTFALTNVLTRRAHAASIAFKAVSVAAGVTLLSSLLLLYQPPNIANLPEFSATLWLALGALVVLIFVVTVGMQYGLTHTPANRAIVICLFEIVAAALSAYFLVDETLSLREWVGGAMIVTATLFSGGLHENAKTSYG
ncbi:MAG: DMT family transporter [Burkholderiales bacterium]